MAAVLSVGLLLMVAALQMAPACAPVALAKVGATGQAGASARVAAYGVLLALLAGSVLGIGGQFVGGYLSARIGESVGRRIKVALFRKVGALPAAQTHEHSIGAMAFRVGGDVLNIRDFFTPGLTQCAGDAFMLIVAFAAMAWFAWPYALPCVFAAGVIALVARHTNRRVNRCAGESQHISERAMTQYIEGVAGYRDLVASDRFGRAADEYDRRLHHQESATLGMYLWSTTASVAPQLVFTANCRRTRSPARSRAPGAIG